MSTRERQAHWQQVYQTKGETDVSWFEESATISLDLIHATGLDNQASVIDIGGGASRLVDALIDEGYSRLAVLDLSERSLALSRARLGSRGSSVDWIVADITTWRPGRTYDIWHDRAAFHFLTDKDDRGAYVDCLRTAVRPGGHVIIGTFAPDGPERCSGLPVFRCDAAMLSELLGPRFVLAESRRHDHHTPGGAVQRFQYSRFIHSM